MKGNWLLLLNLAARHLQSRGAIMENEKHVLVIFAHPDDESFGTAGTILDYTGAGVPVTYICMTLGEMGRNLGNPPLASREGLPAIRTKELDSACAVLGCDVIKLGYRDKTLEFMDEDTVASQLRGYIEKIKPSLVISFYPPYAVHADHNACGRMAIKAVESMPASERPKLHLIAFSKDCEKEVGNPDVVLDISKHARKKLEAIKAHKSQSMLMVEAFESKLDSNDPEIKRRFGFERFWTYTFDK